MNYFHTFLCFLLLTTQRRCTFTWRWSSLWSAPVHTVGLSFDFESSRGGPTLWFLGIFSTRTPTDSAQEEQLGLPHWTMVSAICVLVDVSKSVYILTWVFFYSDGASSILTWVLADTASAACPAHPSSLEIMSMTFAAVICDADDPCSVNTAYGPESSFTKSPPSTTLPLNFLKLWLQLRIHEMTKIHQWREMNFSALIAKIFVCVVTRSTTAEVQHDDMMMRTNVQNDLRHEMALEMWIVSVHEK